VLPPQQYWQPECVISLSCINLEANAYRKVGSPLGGILSDRVVVERTKRRGGIWYPEDRLRVGLLPAGLFVPLSFLLYAVALEYVPGSVGLTICLFCLFVNGVGVRHCSLFFFVCDTIGILSVMLSSDPRALI